MPSDVAASAILKQTFGSTSALEYFHVENTVSTPWKDIAQAASTSSPHPLRLVSLIAWLEHITRSKFDPEEMPATRLLDFFLGVAQGDDTTVALGWQRSVKIAPELAVGPITVELVKKYVLFQVEKSRSA